jgi:hypothetical protein
MTIVRTKNGNGGPCTLLGLFKRENGNAARPMMVYRTYTGEATIPKRLVHLEPCPSCPDHPRSRFPRDWHE